MNTKYQSGQQVNVNSALGATRLVVVEDLGKVLLVCKASEYEDARAEGRKPSVIGFRINDVIEDSNSS